MLWGISGTSLAIVCPPDPCWANDRRYQLQSGKVMQACRNLTIRCPACCWPCCSGGCSRPASPTESSCPLQFLDDVGIGGMTDPWVLRRLPAQQSRPPSGSRARPYSHGLILSLSLANRPLFKFLRFQKRRHWERESFTQGQAVD